MEPEAAEQEEEVPVEDATVILVIETEEESSNTRKETMSCQEMEARQDEQKPTPVDRKPEAAKEEVPKEDAVGKPVKGRKRRHRGKKQAAGRHREPKKLTRGDCESRMQLAAACRKVSHRATVAWHKRNIFRKSMTQGKRGLRHEFAADRNMTSCAGVTRHKGDFVNAEQDTWKGRTTMKNVGGRRPLCRKKKVTTQELIRGCRSGQRSHLVGRRTHKKTFYKTVSEKIPKRIVGSSVSIRQDKDWTLWRG
jgi:hypothetical protein